MQVVQAVGLPAVCAFEMDVIVIMIIPDTMILTKGITRALVVEYFMDDSLFQESPQRAVNCHPIEMLALQRAFQIAM